MELNGVLREAAPQVVSALVRRYADFDTAEDATQEALLAAVTQWPQDGIPRDPRAWLIRVASRRLIDTWRSESARRDREVRDWQRSLALEDPDFPPAEDDSLTLIMLCCHPALARSAQVPLTLRAVGGLTTAQIAGVLLAPEPTVAQRISRAKARLRAVGAEFRLPDDVDERMSSVLQVLYLVFTEGHAAGSTKQTTDPAAEAVRLVRMLRARRPDDGEVAGLLALMLLTRARAGAQSGPDLVTLREQDRSRWDRAAIQEGIALLEDTLPTGPSGPYAVQAAIAAVHAEAPDWAVTDWPQILALYDVLVAIAPGPVTELNRSVAVAMVHGPTAGLQAIERLDSESVLRHSHRPDAVRAHLLELAGDLDAARTRYARAAERATLETERAYLLRRHDACTSID